MLGFLASLIAIAVALAGFVSGARTRGFAGSPAGVRLRTLGGFALSLVATAALAGAVPWRPLAILLGLLLAWLLGVATALIVSLTIPGMGRWRRWLFVSPFAVLAAIMALVGEPPLALAAIFLLPATSRMPWLDRSVGLGARALLLVGSVVAIAAGMATARILPPLPGGMAAIIRLGAACAFSFTGALLLKLLLQFPGRIFDRFRLRTRLLVSYILVAAVPVLLIAIFLLVGAYMSMGSYRAALARRLLAPGEGTRRALATLLLAEPALSSAIDPSRLDPIRAGELEALDNIDNLDDLTRAHFPTTGTFLLATRRELPDTTRFAMRFAPRDLVPPEIAVLRQPLPARPSDALVYAGDRVYTTTAMERSAADHEIILRAFSPLDSQQVRDVAAAIDSEIQVYTVSDTASVTAGSGGATLSIGDEEGPPLLVLASDPEPGSYFGAHIVEGWRIDPSGDFTQEVALLAVKSPVSRVIAVISDTSANQLNIAVLVVLAVIGGLFLLVEAAALVTGSTIARRINGAIAVLHQGTHRLAEDDLDHRIELERGDELGELAGSFNIMAQGLKERRRLAIEHEVMQKELLVAQSIQRRLLPTQVPDFPGLDVAGTSIPSREVGGDAYDFLRWGDGLLVSVADVSGKGIPAAILMSNLHAGLRGQVHRSTNLRRALAELNELVIASTDPGRFITLAIALIDTRTNTVTYANAGHNPPIIRRAGGELISLDTSGILLGVLPGADYEEVEAPLEPGDTLVLYTDGVNEAMNSAGEFFGDDRLNDILRHADGLDAAGICNRVINQVNEFAGTENLSDDLTIVVVRRT